MSDFQEVPMNIQYAENVVMGVRSTLESKGISQFLTTEYGEEKMTSLRKALETFMAKQGTAPADTARGQILEKQVPTKIATAIERGDLPAKAFEDVIEYVRGVTNFDQK